jgi:hypothetical protein
MNRLQRSPTPRRRSPNRSRQTFIVGAIGAMVAVAALATAKFVEVSGEMAAAALGARGEEVYTGSILYVLDENNICRQLLFDNHSGQFIDNGYVDCALAAYHGAFDPPKTWSSARVRVITDGFRQR